MHVYTGFIIGSPTQNEKKKSTKLPMVQMCIFSTLWEEDNMIE